MAPFRPSERRNRSGRQTADHDVFEGLPVRQWRQTEGTFGLPPTSENAEANDSPFPELPMPRDSHLLAPWTQQLLREARKPRFAKRKPEPTEDDKNDDDDESEKKEIQKGFQAKKWSQIPKHLEEADREYLAKRRKGLPSMFAPQVAPVVPVTIPTRKAKVRKVDADGNSIIYEVIVPEGQPVENEVVDEDVIMTEAPKVAPGTVVEGVGIANAEGLVVANNLLQPTPNRRRNPPPKRKKGGPGRPKKKVMFTGPDGQRTSTAPPTGMDTATGVVGPDGTDVTNGVMITNGQEESAANGEGDDDEGEEGEEGDEEGDEDEDREDGELSDTEDATAPPSTSLQPQETAYNAVPVADLTAESVSDNAAPPLPMIADATDDVALPTAPAPEQEVDSAMSSSSAAPVAEKAVAEEAIAEEAVIEEAITEPPVTEPILKLAQSLNAEPMPVNRDVSSSPDLPLAKSSHSNQELTSNMEQVPSQPSAVVEQESEMDVDSQSAAEPSIIPETIQAPEQIVQGEAEKEAESAATDDLLGKFEKELDS